MKYAIGPIMMVLGLAIILFGHLNSLKNRIIYLEEQQKQTINIQERQTKAMQTIVDIIKTNYDR